MTYFTSTGKPLPASLTQQAAASELILSAPGVSGNGLFLWCNCRNRLCDDGPDCACTGLVDAQMGGTVRIQQQLVTMRDPRKFDFNSLATFTTRWLEYLVQYNSDGTFTPVPAGKLGDQRDATEYVLHVREGVTWNNGDPFTAEDVRGQYRALSATAPSKATPWLASCR